MTEPKSTVPYGYCHCGCGQRTPLSAENDASKGRAKGEPMQYIQTHNSLKPRVTPRNTKVCTKCGIEQPVENFGARRTPRYRINPQCKACTVAYRKANRDRLRANVRKWEQRNRLKCNAYKHRYAATKYGARGDYNPDDVWALGASQDWLCAYCETPLFGIFDVDHMIPISRGGSNGVENLAIACPPCNRSKSYKTAEEFWQYRKQLGQV